MGPGPVTNPRSQSKRMPYTPPQRWGITRAAPQPSDQERREERQERREERRVENAHEAFARIWGMGMLNALPTSSLGPVGSARRDT